MIKRPLFTPTFAKDLSMSADIATDLVLLQDSFSSASDEIKSLIVRITSEIDFVNKLSELHSEEAEAWRILSRKALDVVQGSVAGGKMDSIRDAVAEAEAILAPVAETAKSYTIWCVGHGHIDMNWMWSWPETVAVTNDTFSTVDHLMSEYPDFCYSQSQTSVYEIARKYNPQLFQRIKKRVAEGRWEPTACMWVEGDKNLAGGESLCRHLLYTRQFMEEHFGLKPADILIDWEPDTFGHAHTIPHFLARAGVRRYYFCRGGADPKPSVFWWEGPDGSRVLCYREITWYNWEIRPELTNHLVAFAKETGLRAWMNVYGVGDHGGGPTREHIEWAHRMDSWPVFPSIKLSTTKPFYELLERNSAKWEVLKRELNFEFTGCYTTQTSIKRNNRFAEQLLYQAEAASSLAWLETAQEYPETALREGWINTLFSQFHDILPGSCVRPSREYNSGQYQETAAGAGMALTNSLRAVASEIDTTYFGASGATGSPAKTIGGGAGFESGMGAVSGYDGGSSDVRPFVVYNLNGWERSEVVIATVWNSGWKDVVVQDDAGNRFLGQIVEKGGYWGHEFVKVAFPALKISASGYRVFALTQGHAPVAACALAHVEHGAENEYFRLEMDWNTGGIKSLVEKGSGRDLAIPGRPMGLLEYAVERHHGMSAWVIGDIQASKFLGEITSLEEKRGPYQISFVAKAKVNESRITIETIVRAGCPLVEVVISANWLERGGPDAGVPSLRFHVPVNVESDSALFETPYGTVRRTLTAGEEVPSQRWVDLSGKNAGVTVVNDSKYGHAIDGRSVRTTLIRSAYDPDPLPEVGEQRIRMGVLPHGADWKASAATRAGVDFNQPLVVVGTGVHSGRLPNNASFLSVDEPNIILAAVKRSEDGEAIIVRFYETDGSRTDAHVRFGAFLALSEVAAVDLLERATEGRVERNGNTIRVEVPPFGISSLKVLFAK